MRFLLLSCAVLALAGCHETQQSNQAAPSAEAGPVKGIDRSHKGQPAPNASFDDPDGKPISLAKFKGVPVLVNLWATWCIPCRKELPSLDRLAATHRDDGELGVVTISEDFGPQPSVKAFLATLKVKDLGAYQDPKSGLLGPDTVLPTSMLIDANGKEVWRYVGDLDWTSSEAAKLLAEAGASSKKP